MASIPQSKPQDESGPTVVVPQHRANAKGDDSRIIKKYPNRRLYDTATSSYITLAEVKRLVLDNAGFQVVDAKTGEDLTRSILLQIILDEEGHQGVPVFTNEVLTLIIRFYGHAMQNLMGGYLERSVRAFVDMQQKLQEQAKAIYGDAPQLSAEGWAQMFRNQPGMPGLMSSYLEQSAQAFMEAQEQMRRQAMSFFGVPVEGDNTNPGDTPPDKSGGSTG